MKKLVLILMIALMAGSMNVIANTTQSTEQVEDAKKRKPRKNKKKQKRAYSSHHSWSKVSTGRTCNKKRRR
jgi:Ni/Co efflux regulator RcnB